MKQSAKGTDIQQAGGDIINNKINNYNYLQKKLPSYLYKVIYNLNGIIDSPPSNPWSNKEAHDIQTKIDFNNLLKYKIIVEEYGNFAAIVESAYNSLDEESINGKAKFLRSIHLKYLNLKGDLFKENPNENIEDLVRENADNILDSIVENLRNDYLNSTINQKINIEDVEFCIVCILIKAFIDCKVLETPDI